MNLWPSDFERLRLLRLVRVLRTREYVELAVHATAERVLRQHALDRELDHPLGMLIEQLLEGDLLDAADVSRVMEIELVGELAPRDANLLGVHDDDVVA